jgi:predicted dehydrogenase
MKKTKFVVAQIGCGYWGPNLLRNFSAIPTCRVKYVVDGDSSRRAFVASKFPAITVLSDADAVFADPEVDATIIATPAATHFSLAHRSLSSGKHAFVEKPLATSTAQANELARLALAGSLVLMVGHTFVYNAAVRHVKTLIEQGHLGELRYIYSQRLNLGRIRTDIDALWNFAPHDISIIQYWLGDPEPVRVLRSGMAYIQPTVEDVVFLNIRYPGRVMAHIHVSWLDPQKVRKMVVVGSRRMVVYDDMADDKVAILDKGIDVRAELGKNMDFDSSPTTAFSYRSGDILLPMIKFDEPLRVQAEHFLSCMAGETRCLTGPDHARRVVQILEAAQQS